MDGQGVMPLKGRFFDAIQVQSSWGSTLHQPLLRDQGCI